MRVAICEDEQVFQERVKALALKWAQAALPGEEFCVETFDSAEAFCSCWKKRRFDLAILDIQMRLMNGFELAQEIRAKDEHMEIIFLTSYSTYALDGYSVDARAYLLKPPKEEQLYQALERAARRIRAREKDVLFVPVANAQVGLRLREVLYFESRMHYVEAHSVQGVTRLGARLSLEQLRRRLPDYFVQSHRSYILNALHLLRITRTEAILSDGSKIFIGRTYLDQVRERFAKFYGM